MAILNLLLVILVFHGATAYSRLEDSCKHQGLYPHPEDCHKYMVCINDEDGDFSADSYTCPDGLAFSSEKNDCVPVEEVPMCSLQPSLTLEESSCHNNTLSCEECSVLVICKNNSGNFDPIESVNCSAMGLPFCDNDIKRCTDRKPASCYKCTANGFYPVPTDCSKYLRCIATGTIVKQCPESQVYSACDNTCHPREDPTDCHEVKCNSNFEYQAYPGCQRFYVLCIMKSPEYVFSCAMGEIFDGISCKKTN